MACTRKQYIFAAEQIEVPDDFPGILKNFTKAAVREQPDQESFVSFARSYFEQILDKRGYFDEQKRQEAEAKAAAESRVRVKPKDYITNFTDQMLNYYMVREIVDKESHDSETRLVIHRATGDERLAKIYKKNEFDPSQLPRIGEELKILLDLDHPYVQRVIEVFEDDDRLYILYEKPKGGALFDKLAVDEEFNEYKAAKVCTQLLKALQFSHGKGIVHRDINPACVWFDDEAGYQVKLGGFGQSRVLKPGSTFKQKVEAAYYSPPQIIQEQEYGAAADLWGVGVLTYMMLSGVIPFDGKDEATIKNGIINNPIDFPAKHWKNISSNARDFLTRLFEKDEANRMTAEEALEHPWITSNSLEKEVGDTSYTITLNHIKNFQAGSLLKQAAMTFLIQNLSSRSELEELNKVFVELDTNGNGTISKEELFAGYKKIFGNAFSPEEVEELFKKADTDESGSIDYSEWATVTYSHWNLLSTAKLEDAFALFDTDGDAKVSEEEIRAVFQVLDHIDSAQLETMLRDEMDETKSLSLPQFKSLMNKILM